MNHRNTQPRLNVLQAGLLLLSLALAPLAHSENLTEDDVTSFIASMEAMQPLIDKHQDFIESIEDPADDEREVDFARMMSSMVDEVKGHEMYDDLDDLVDDFILRVSFGSETPQHNLLDVFDARDDDSV